MIITLKGATASKNLGGLNFYSIIVNKSSGVTVTLNKTTVDKAAAASTTVTGTLTVSEGYTLSSVKIMMGDTDKTSAWYNASTGAITISGITANVVITANATSNSGGEDEPETPEVTYIIDSYLDSTGAVVEASGQSAGGWSITDYTEVISGKSFKYIGTVPGAALETVPYCVWGYDANLKPIESVVASVTDTYLNGHEFTITNNNIKYIVACGFVRNGTAFSLEYV